MTFYVLLSYLFGSNRILNILKRKTQIVLIYFSVTNFEYTELCSELFFQCDDLPLRTDIHCIVLLFRLLPIMSYISDSFYDSFILILSDFFFRTVYLIKLF